MLGHSMEDVALHSQTTSEKLRLHNFVVGLYRDDIYGGQETRHQTPS
jgi:hypothetical protein